MLLNYIIFGVSICFISWVFAILINSMLLKTSFYEKYSNLNFVKSKTINKYLGVHLIKWVIKNTFFKYFNQSIAIRSKDTDLYELRHQMTSAEISHFVGFGFVMVFAVYKGFVIEPLFGMVITIINIMMNLHPSLLQQENKRRLDKLLKRQDKLAKP